MKKCNLKGDRENVLSGFWVKKKKKVFAFIPQVCMCYFCQCKAGLLVNKLCYEIGWEKTVNIEVSLLNIFQDKVVFLLDGLFVEWSY